MLSSVQGPQSVDKKTQLPVLTSPVEINEILELIFSYLSGPRLRIAAQVSRRWRLVASVSLQYCFHIDESNPKTWKDLTQKILMADSLIIGKIPAPNHSKQYCCSSSRVRTQWQKLIALLDQATQAAATVDSNRHKNHRLHFKALTIYVESWWGNNCRGGTLFNAAQLTHLTLFMNQQEWLSNHIEWTLDQCPNLSSLALYAGDPNRGTNCTLLSYPVAPRSENDSDSILASWPLQSLSIKGLCLSLRKLHSVIPRMRQLRSLSLLHCKTAELNDLRNTRRLILPIWHNLAQYCPQLKAIAFAQEDAVIHIPIAILPSVVDLGIDFRCIDEGYLSMGTRYAGRMENRLTSLEVVGLRHLGGVNYSRVDVLLHQFLSSAPLLLHLEVATTILSTQALIGNWDRRFWDRFGNKSTDVSPSFPKLWACRRLSTLSIVFSARDDPHWNDWSRNMTHFGYLGRVCPQLQELSVVVREWNTYWSLDLSLLTRLHNLRRLELRFFEDSIDLEQNFLGRADFAWIQPTHPSVVLRPVSTDNFPFRTRNSPQRERGERTLSFWRPLDKAAQRAESLHSVDPEKDFRDCLEKARANSLTEYRYSSFNEQRVDELSGEANGQEKQEAWKSAVMDTRRRRRARMMEQQKEAGFRNDYNRDIPMVDGLEDFAFCGSHLDVEACLLARIWRAQQQRKSIEGVRSATADVYARPWPNMEEFIFMTVSFSSFSEKKAMQLEGRCKKACGILRQMRSDIDVLCRSSLQT